MQILEVHNGGTGGEGFNDNGGYGVIIPTDSVDSSEEGGPKKKRCEQLECESAEEALRQALQVVTNDGAEGVTIFSLGSGKVVLRVIRPLVGDEDLFPYCAVEGGFLLVGHGGNAGTATGTVVTEDCPDYGHIPPSCRKMHKVHGKTWITILDDEGTVLASISYAGTFQD